MQIRDAMSGSALRPSVLLVEDERELACAILEELQYSGHKVEHAATWEAGLSAARLGIAGVMVVDRMLDGKDGLKLLEILRNEGFTAPVLVISAMSSVDDRVFGLKAGGDDYLVKPFAIPELTARVEALARRSRNLRTTWLKVGPLELDLIDRTAKREGVPIDLQPREFKLLEYFMRRPGQIVTRAMLLEDVWGYKFLPQTNVIDVHIGNLRRKLELDAAPRLIINVRSAGFMLDVAS